VIESLLRRRQGPILQQDFLYYQIPITDPALIYPQAPSALVLVASATAGYSELPAGPISGKISPTQAMISAPKLLAQNRRLSQPLTFDPASPALGFPRPSFA